MNNIGKASAFIVTEVHWPSWDSSPGTKSFWTCYVMVLFVALPLLGALILLLVVPGQLWSRAGDQDQSYISPRHEVIV